MTPDISKALFARLRRQVGLRCGYCRTSAAVVGQPLTVEHIIPRARGGSSEENNRPDIVAARLLWVAAGWHPPQEGL
jgi:hypothetical protein